MEVSERGEINGWTCDKCGKTMYGVHVDKGVTPMFLGCRETPGCSGTGQSIMYPPPPVPSYVIAGVCWEWYRPGPREHRRLHPDARDHVEKGGLLIRPLSDFGRTAIREATHDTE